MDLKLVFAPWVIRGRALVRTRAGERDEFMAALVYNKAADLTLESLLPEAPVKAQKNGKKAMALRSHLLTRTTQNVICRKHT